MSTTFGIIIKENKLLNISHDENWEDISEEEDVEVVEVAYRRNGISWMTPLAPFLHPDTKVYALDNSQQGIFTIKDINDEIQH